MATASLSTRVDVSLTDGIRTYFRQDDAGAEEVARPQPEESRGRSSGRPRSFKRSFRSRNRKETQSGKFRNHRKGGSRQTGFANQAPGWFLKP